MRWNQQRSTGELIDIHSTPRSVLESLRIRAHGRELVGNVLLQHPLAERTQRARAVPIIPRQFDAVQIVEDRQCGRLHINQFITVQLQPLQTLPNAVERTHLDATYPAIGQFEAYQSAQAVERGIVQSQHGIAGQSQFPQLTHRVEDVRRDSGQPVVAQVQFDEVDEVAERVPMELR